MLIAALFWVSYIKASFKLTLKAIFLGLIPNPISFTKFQKGDSTMTMFHVTPRQLPWINSKAADVILPNEK